MEKYIYPCCNEDDSFDASVRCDRCRKWFHFSCVGVDDSIADLVWFCLSCVGEDESIRRSMGMAGRTKTRSQSHITTRSGNSKLGGESTKSLDPKKITKDSSKAKALEENKNKRDELIGYDEVGQVVENSNQSMQNQSARDISNVEQANVLCNDPTGSRGGRRSRSLMSTDSKRVRALRELKMLEEISKIKQLEEENERKILELEKRQLERQRQEAERMHMLKKIADEESELDDEDVSGDDKVDYHEKVRNWSFGKSDMNPKSKLPKKTGAIRKVSHNLAVTKKIRNSISINPPDEDDVSDVSSTSSNFSNDGQSKDVIVKECTKYPPAAQKGPSRIQIASRQVYSKNLPKFAGDPQEWPLFISTYEQANQSCGFSNAENLIRLQEALKGKALEAVRHRMLLPDNVPIIIEKLRKRFGNPEILSTMLANRIRQLPGPNSENLETIIEFGSAIEEFTEHLKAAKLTDHLKNPILMQNLVQKLPASYAMEWVTFKRKSRVVDLETFGAFMEELVEKALEVTFEKIVSVESTGSKKRDNLKVKGFIHTTDGDCDNCCHKPSKELSNKIQENNVNTLERKFDLKCSICLMSGHYGRNCIQFRSLNLDDRWRTVRQLGLCTLCLFNHGEKPCRSKFICGVNGCSESHNSILHGLPTAGPSRVEGRCNSHLQSGKKILFRMMPVTLYNGPKVVHTLALIDEGSSVTLIEAEVAELLDADGELEPLKMCWTNGVSRTEERSKRLHLDISGRNMPDRYKLMSARTVTKLDLPLQGLDSRKLTQQLRYMNDIDIPCYDVATPKVLIGIDNMHLISPLDSRIGDSGCPIAVQCRLGWTMYGPCPGLVANIHFIAHHRCMCEECCTSDRQFDAQLKDFFQLEAVGAPQIQLESRENRRAREILKKTTKRIGDRFETGLLWRDDDTRFPESYSLAEKRLRSLEIRMNRNPGVGDSLQKQLKEYIQKGYAHLITERELRETLPEKTWYLPLNFVINPKKPDKVRFVWDAAAKSNGVSLNDKLLKGPDMLTSLSAVINSFRERKVAFGGDIREMFHQIKIRSEDRQAQRFLFRMNSSDEPQIYVMDVVIFGASCSPCTSQFVKNLNAEDYTEEFPEATAAIMNKHYVDDYYDSVDTVDEAVRRAKEVKQLHAKGGFEIRDWICNSPEVLRQLGTIQSEEFKPLHVDEGEEAARVLGVRWNSVEDVFVFSMDMRQSLQQYMRNGAWPTKRIALKCIMSMFDPKQFLAPLTIHGRILMQDLWRSGIDWDEKLKQEHYERWLKWTGLFPLIDAIKVPRCYLGDTNSKAYESVQLHVFVDAGEEAYGCVAYFRFNDQETIHCAFVEAKAKVVPLQYLSIPRKELEAAVLGARLSKTIRDNHSFPIRSTFFWTDSNAVFSWVRSEQRKYKPFVAHRIGEILSITNPDDWRWVPTKMNAADDLTKWGKTTELRSDSRWFRGPEFIYLLEKYWPEQKQVVNETVEELRASLMFHEIELPVGLVQRIQHVSRWNVLIRILATVIRFISNCKRRIQHLPIEALPSRKEINRTVQIPAIEVPLRQEEHLAAENCLWRVAQSEEYADTIKVLLKNKELAIGAKLKLERSDQLCPLSPFLDEFGVVRMEGRIARAEYLAFDARYPIILPKKHVITAKLLEHYHRLCGHGSRETVVNEVRQRFYIPCLRSLVQKIMRSCQWCKIKKTKPTAPRMAPLPKQRLAARVDPFSYVGIDYFGPLEVTIGRRKEKRWVALFTCMAVRAVHLEVAYSLTTESCKMAIRRFVKRRGSPIEIFTDNGTNFVGASRELVSEIRRIHVDCADTFTSARTRWNFNPPAAPHMGGVWERMVRSVKEAMKVFADGGKLTDEILQTVLAESEDLINSRPLTYASTNSKEDPEAITPNHFLRGRSSAQCLPSRIPIDVAKSLRSSYNRAQYLSDELWHRWQREYLPSINKRSKWFIEQRQMTPGDLVFIVNGDKRNMWERGIVTEVFTGADGRVRSATVRTKDGVKIRPVTSLAVLEISESKPNKDPE